MHLTKSGQIVKFHSPLEDEDPTQLYVILEIHNDVEIPRTQIKALNTGFSFPPINTDYRFRNCRSEYRRFDGA